jgi:hypothetical protein
MESPLSFKEEWEANRNREKKRKNKSKDEFNGPKCIAVPIMGERPERLLNSANFDLPVCVL